MPVSRVGSALAVLLLGCGSPGEVLDVGTRQPRFVQQGACAPSTSSVELQVELRTSSCARALAASTLADDEAAFRALFDEGCEVPAVDFTARRALVLSARGAQGFLFPQFVHARGDALEVGVLERRLGSVPPTNIVLLPLTPATVELRSCREVCVQNCDVPIP